MTYYKILFLVFCLLASVSVYASDVSPHIITMEHEIVTDQGSFADSVLLFTHMDHYYLDFHTDHISFELLNETQLKEGVYIRNKEKSGVQYVVHHYRVDTFFIDPIKQELYVSLVSNESKVTTLGIFKMTVKSVVNFSLISLGDDTFKLKSSIILTFKNKKDLWLARFVKTRRIWQKHLAEELEAGSKIVAKGLQH
ncbi:hypothetical protein DID74_02425 [Candidatus Marinamargulisbacteria bacterium SCGC AG-333-B06]|nr:hypothetical protein DID74_02425 [Candidatus Marinamargulisbacteria bacterium SCGC AG-333-B06]